MTFQLWNELYHGYLSNKKFLLWCFARDIVTRIRARRGDEYAQAHLAGWNLFARLMRGEFNDVEDAAEADVMIARIPEAVRYMHEAERKDLVDETRRIVRIYSRSHESTKDDSDVILLESLVILDELLSRNFPEMKHNPPCSG